MADRAPRLLAVKISEWQKKHPGKRITTEVLAKLYHGSNVTDSLAFADLSHLDLSSADLRGANMEGAYCHSTIFNGANLNDANLNGACLRNADLVYSHLRETDLRNTDLNGVDLRSANSSIFLVVGLHRYPMWAVPAKDGWQVTIGCWRGTTDDLRELIAGENWPESSFEQRKKLRPVLSAFADMCDEHAKNYSVLDW